MSSLQEQLLKAGLTTAHKARQVKTDKKKNKQNNVANQQNLKAHLDENKKQQQLKAQQANEAKQQALKEKEDIARAKQILEHHNQKDIFGDQVFNFTHQGKIKEVKVNATTRAALVKGRLAICFLDGQYFVIPDEPAQKIAAIAEHFVVLHAEPEQKPDQEDPYAGYEVPDDLVW